MPEIGESPTAVVATTTRPPDARSVERPRDRKRVATAAPTKPTKPTVRVAPARTLEAAPPLAPAPKPLDLPPAKPVDAPKPPKPADAEPAKPVDAAAHAPAKPAPVKTCDTTVPPVEGIEPAAISALYYKVADDVTALPPGATQARLWTRFQRYSVQSLMRITQQEREAAAVTLWKIHNEAACNRTR